MRHQVVEGVTAVAIVVAKMIIVVIDHILNQLIHSRNHRLKMPLKLDRLTLMQHVSYHQLKS